MRGERKGFTLEIFKELSRLACIESRLFWISGNVCFFTPPVAGAVLGRVVNVRVGVEPPVPPFLSFILPHHNPHTQTRRQRVVKWCDNKKWRHLFIMTHNPCGILPSRMKFRRMSLRFYFFLFQLLVIFYTMFMRSGKIRRIGQPLKNIGRRRAHRICNCIRIIRLNAVREKWGRGWERQRSKECHLLACGRIQTLTTTWGGRCRVVGLMSIQ